MGLIFGTPVLAVMSIASLALRPQGRMWALLALVVCAVNIALIFDLTGHSLFGEQFSLAARLGSCAVK
ncbi:MAG: hypothetical protein AB7N71_02465 [Phycisphaerae bacterium]